MTTRLRPHHLLCMLTFVGEGYSAAFVENFEQIARRISTGNETVEIAAGPDDVCAPLLSECGHHCAKANVLVRDRLAAEALSGLLRLPIQANERFLLDRGRLKILRQAFRAGTIRGACTGCQWKPLCDEIAEKNFSGTRLLSD